MPFILILSAAVILVSLAYLGNRLFKALRCVYPRCSKAVFRIVYTIFIIAIVYFKSSLFGAIVYSIVLFPLIDIIKYILKKINLPPKLGRFCRIVYLKGFLAVVLALILNIQALCVASAPKETGYTVKSVHSLKRDYNIVFVSDMHIGGAVTEKLIDEFVENTNSKQPDIICFGGDIFDESTGEYYMEYAFSAFSRLKSTCGIYYVYGNHERMNDEEKIKTEFEKIGVKVLCDEVTLINNDLYLVGRLDYGQTGGNAAKRKSIPELLENIDKSKTVVVLDHHPADIDACEQNGVDLQLSGHTHAGQLFPFNLFTGIFNEVSYGQVTRGDYCIIVSSGYGTWGFPIRSGSHSETVNVRLTN